MSEKAKPGDVILRTHRNDNYKTISCVGLDDPTLSWQAKGLLMYLITRPDGWKFRRSHLLRLSTNKEHSFRGVLRELRSHGYLCTKAHRGPDGTFWGQQWQVSESPIADWITRGGGKLRGGTAAGPKGLNAESPQDGEPSTHYQQGVVTSSSSNNKKDTDQEGPAQASPSRAASGLLGRDKQTSTTTATWLTPYYEAVKKQYGGEPHAKKLTKFMAPLHSKHGLDKTLAHFRNYLDATAAQFFSPARFAETFGAWGPDPRRTKVHRADEPIRGRIV